MRPWNCAWHRTENSCVFVCVCARSARVTHTTRTYQHRAPASVCERRQSARGSTGKRERGGAREREGGGRKEG